MSDSTAIEWTDATWNVINGCSVVSPGCTHCYAMRLAGTRFRDHPTRQGLTIDSKAGPVWNGQVRFNEKVATDPIRWRRPRRIFVCAHGDLFHEAVPDAWIDRVFTVMALADQHIFQILTKRPERMRAYLTGQAEDRVTARGFDQTDQLAGREMAERLFGIGAYRWPLPNVWLGVSVEDQARAVERIPILLETPAAVRWISAEPLLGPVDLSRYLFVGKEGGLDFAHSPRQLIDWVVLGGESGPGARPMHPDWVRPPRDQCAAAGVPFFFKQWGDWAPVCALTDGQTDSLYEPWSPRNPEGPRRCRVEKYTLQRDGSRHDPAEPGAWQQDTGPMLMLRAGKRAAGRWLDGVLHDGFPEVR